MTGPATATVVNRPDRRQIVLQVHQPVRQGATGIWTVTGGTYLG